MTDASVDAATEVLHKALDTADPGQWHYACARNPDDPKSCHKGDEERRMLAEDVTPVVLRALLDAGWTPPPPRLHCGADRGHAPHTWTEPDVRHDCPGGVVDDDEARQLRDRINARGELPFNVRMTRRTLDAVRTVFPDGGFDPDDTEHQRLVAVASGSVNAGPVARRIASRTMAALAEVRP